MEVPGHTGYLAHDCRSFGRRESAPAPDDGGQRLTIYELHQNAGPTLVFVEAQVFGDARVPQAGLNIDPVIGHIRKDIAAAREYGFNRANKTRTMFGAGFDTLYPSKASFRIGDDTTSDPDDASQNARASVTVAVVRLRITG
jgi:hypothetical protein